MEDRHLCKARPIGTRKQWVTGFYAVLGEKTVIIVNEPEKFYDVDSGKNSHGNKIEEVIPNTICQCTGLKDKNGKLIWENDIIKCKCGIAVVVWDKSEWRIKWVKDNIWRKDLHFWVNDENELRVEVIGNAIDNPELLEVGE